MKGLKDLTMHSLRFSLFLSLTFSTLGAEAFISDIKEQSFKLQQKRVEVESRKLSSSWIEPIELIASKSYNNQFGADQKNTLYKVSINQPIFKSGGIFFAIKYANAKGRFENLSVKEQRRALIKEAVGLLMKIKRTELQSSRQELVLKNARIDLLRKREQYDSGQIDSGFLDNAVLAKNSSALALLDIKSAKNDLIAAFESISELSWTDVKLPILSLVSEKEFFDEHLEVKKAKADVLQNEYFQNVTVAKYLPTFRLNASYNDVNNENFAFGNGINFSSADSYYQYGVSASWMFLDVNILRDIESSKLGYLKAKNAQIDLKNTLTKRYKKILNNINIVDEKLKLTLEDKNLYAKLSTDTKELYEAGQKSIYDVQTLENSEKVQRLNFDILSLDRQLLLLELYEKSEREF